jgi:hypothetical protein
MPHLGSSGLRDLRAVFQLILGRYCREAMPRLYLKASPLPPVLQNMDRGHPGVRGDACMATTPWDAGHGGPRARLFM